MFLFGDRSVPQLGAMPINAGRIYIVYKAAQHLRHCDGVIFSTSPEFEPGVAERLQKELGKPVYQIGCVSGEKCIGVVTDDSDVYFALCPLVRNFQTGCGHA